MIINNIKSNLNFTNPEEAFKPEIIYPKNNDISKIEGIEFIEKDDFKNNFLSLKSKSQKHQIKHEIDDFVRFRINDDERLDIKIKNEKSKETTPVENKQNENIEPEENKQNADKIKKEDQKELSKLLNNINENEIITYPGEVKPESIDKSLADPNLAVESEKFNKAESDEVFGVNRVKVFYSIDKSIYSTRSASANIKEKLKNVKKGILLPASVGIISFLLLIPTTLGLSIYFKHASKATLEESFINDQSILAEIAKKREEEARLATLRLAEERKQLDEEKAKFKNLLNEELLRKESEIEQKYNQKLKDMQAGGVSNVEIEKYKKELEIERETALKAAKDERDKKLEEQEKALVEKDTRIKDALESLSQKSQSYEEEMIRLKKEFETRNLDEAKKVEAATAKLSEIKELNDKIDNFNLMVYQLINSSITDFKNNSFDPAMQKLNSLLKYYNSNIDFVNTNNTLKNKMETDIFFVETIKTLFDESKNTILGNKELSKIIEKFKKINLLYQKAELLYNDGNFIKSAEEFENVLREMDETNNSYNRLKQISKNAQNKVAENYYKLAKENMIKEKYPEALAQLSSIINETPESSYTPLALSDIMRINDLLSYTKKVNTADEKVISMLNEAERKKAENNYSEALKIFENMLTLYPFSSYTKKALDEIKSLNDNMIKKQITEKIDSTSEDLKSKFLDDYKKFQNSYNNNDMESARKYYFEALRKAFDVYTNNTISGFKAIEDKYIEALLKDREKKASEKGMIEGKISGSEKAIALEKELDILRNKYLELDKKYSEKIDDKKIDLKNIFQSDYNKYLDFYKMNDVENARKYYFEALRKAFDNYTGNSISSFKMVEDKYIENLIKDREKKMQQSILNGNENNSGKMETIENELKALKEKYIELEKKYNERLKKDADRERTELKKNIEGKYTELKQKEIEFEKLKLEKEFNTQLEKIKKSR